MVKLKWKHLRYQPKMYTEEERKARDGFLSMLHIQV